MTTYETTCLEDEVCGVCSWWDLISGCRVGKEPEDCCIDPEGEKDFQTDKKIDSIRGGDIDY